MRDIYKADAGHMLSTIWLDKRFPYLYDIIGKLKDYHQLDNKAIIVQVAWAILEIMGPRMPYRPRLLASADMASSGP